MVESWLPVPGYENRYEVSDHGRVRSLDLVTRSGFCENQLKRGRVLRQHVKGQGYLSVRLYHDSMPARRWMVHRLVLTAFVSPCPDGMEGCHHDGNPENNNLSNLRWDTRSANMQDIKRHGRHNCVNKTHCKNGHPFTDANTAISGSNGQRVCITCRRAWGRARKRRLKELRNVV